MSTETPEEVATRVRGQLRGWRSVQRTADPRSPHPGEVTLSAEKGYTRELGNLVFHLALVALLVSIAVGKLFGYEGSVIVIADDGPGFCSTSPAAFDSFRAGNVRDGTGMAPICVRVKDFKADYLENGQAEMFTSNIAYQAGDDLETNTWRDATLQVNHPLRVAGDRVYLQGHGYAPTFTVTFPNGETRTETLQWRPDDATTFLSTGAMRFDPPGGMYPDADERRKNQIALEGLFAPTASLHGTLLSSSFPAMTDPAVAIDIYKGDAGLDTGIPQSLFSLNKELVNQGRLVKQARVNLVPGQSTTLPDGTAGPLRRGAGVRQPAGLARPRPGLGARQRAGDDGGAARVAGHPTTPGVAACVPDRRAWRTTYGSRAGRAGPHRSRRLGRRVRPAARPAARRRF